MKIGVHYKNGNLSSVDARHLELGNPGMGGRQYMNLMIAYHLAKDSRQSVEPMVFMEREGAIPDGLTSCVCGNVASAFKAASAHGVDYFITDVSISLDAMKKIIGLAEQIGLKLIVRLGLIPSSAILHLLNKSFAVAAVVCVENQVLELLRDHPVLRKTTVVPNGISMTPYQSPIIPIDEREPIVTFVGSLVPQKGFGRLAKVWPKVLRTIPNAQLRVIGSGSLYKHDRTLGKWGVAGERFEATQIRPYLSDAKGRPHPSVQFLGVLGHDKLDVLRRSMIGVANPIGNTETFCISAVEIQAAGTPVIAGAKYGLLDTVHDGKTGFLVRNEKTLTKRITDLLTDRNLAERMAISARSYVEERYDFNRIVHVWQDLLGDLNRGSGVRTPPPKRRPVAFGAAIARYNGALRHLVDAGNWWPTYLGTCDRIDHVKKMVRNYDSYLPNALRAAHKKT